MHANAPPPAFTQHLFDSGVFIGASDRGVLRPTNEDRYLVRCLANGAVLLAVADGLGNGGAGRYAAEMIMQTLSGLGGVTRGQVKARLRQVVRDLDRAVFEAAAADARLEGMGSTLIAALLHDDRLTWVHAGDSRLYLLRGGHLTPLTTDQTLARFLLAEGELSSGQAVGHYAHQVMDQYVGCGFCEPETGQLASRPGDLIFLCSDGVHRQLDDIRLSALLNAPGTPQARAAAVLAAALKAGGVDNATLAMAQRYSVDPPAPAA